MMTTDKAPDCSGCRLSYLAQFRDGGILYCAIPGSVSVRCADARKDMRDCCGPAGRYYEPKGNPNAPE